MKILNYLAIKQRGYRRRFNHEYSMWRYRRAVSRSRKAYHKWEAKLIKKAPEVFLGPDFPSGGVRGHVRAIQKHSSLSVELVPSLGGLDSFTVDARKLFNEFEPSGPVAVHSHVLPWMIHWCRKQQIRGVKWVHTYHLPYFDDHGKGGLEPWQVEINEALLGEARHADVRLSVARWQQAYLRTEHGIETDYLPNGVDLAACDQGDAGRFQQWSRIETPFVLHVSRNDPVKNPAEFVRLATRHPDLRFVVIGDGLDETVMAREWQTASPKNLHYLGGRSHLEVQDALAACSVLVVTSKREGLPTLVLEAMGHGKPVVVPQEAGCLEAIDHGRYGFTYPLGDLKSLSMALTDALGDTERCVLARQRILEHYDWRVVVRQLDVYYRS
jgi:glycosyltransferase involved in cell wall biosynthesis